MTLGNSHSPHYGIAVGGMTCRASNISGQNADISDMSATSITYPAPPATKTVFTIPEVVAHQCRESRDNIYYSGYAATSATDKEPVLATYGIQTCIGLVVYNKKNTTAVMAHLATTQFYPTDFLSNGLWPIYADNYAQVSAAVRSHAPVVDTNLYMAFMRMHVLVKGDNEYCDVGGEWGSCALRELPYSWYLSTFRTQYFRNTKAEDLDITIIAGKNTDRNAIKRLMHGLVFFFPESSLTLVSSEEDRIGARFDSRAASLEVYSLGGMPDQNLAVTSLRN